MSDIQNPTEGWPAHPVAAPVAPTTTNGNDTASPQDGGAVVRSGGLPRLGDPRVSRKERKKVEVELPGVGGSLLLQAPTIGTVVDFQDRIDEAGEITNRRGLEQIVAMGSLMLVEPDWSEDDLRAAATEWVASDFAIFRDAVLELAGGGDDEEARSAVRADFLDTDDR